MGWSRGAFAIAALVMIGSLSAIVWHPAVGMGLAAVVALICVIVISRASVAGLGVAAIVAFALTASWDQISVGGFNPRFAFLAAGLVLLLVGSSFRGALWVPWWIHSFGLASIVVTVLLIIFPVSLDYLSSRYETSEAGYALGSRAGIVPSMAYLLTNVYLVPLGVGLAIAAIPKATRIIVGAYVGGVAWSSLAAYLGFVGFPWLADLLAEPVPAGIRALGYSNHPLHLATSCVMALGFAVWMGLQPTRRTRWFGWGATISILLGVYASGSRGGNVAVVLLLAVSVFFIPQVRQRWHIALSGVLVLCSVAMLMVPALAEAFLRTTRILGGDASAAASDAGRAEVFRQALTDFGHSPIYGIGTRFMAEAHVLYAGVLASGGVILMLGYILFNVGSIRAAGDVASDQGALGSAVLSTLLASLGYWTVGDEFTVPEVQFVYGVLLGLLLLRRRRREPSHRPPTGEAGGVPTPVHDSRSRHELLA